MEVLIDRQKIVRNIRISSLVFIHPLQEMIKKWVDPDEFEIKFHHVPQTPMKNKTIINIYDCDYEKFLVKLTGIRIGNFFFINSEAVINIKFYINMMYNNDESIFFDLIMDPNVSIKLNNLIYEKCFFCDSTKVIIPEDTLVCATISFSHFIRTELGKNMFIDNLVVYPVNYKILQSLVI
jgi:hypothetical protein